MKYKVTKKAKRPALKENRCFYCNQKIGDYHKNDCVLLRKKVKIRAIIEYEVSMPSNFTKHDIEFSRNEGSWCGSNIIEELEELNMKHDCLCDFVEFEYLEDTSNHFLKE